MCQSKSTQRMNSIHKASHTSFMGSRLKVRESRNRNGTAKWKAAINNPTHCQPPCRRRMYQVISSGKFPAQIISSCENEKYAHNIMKVSMNFPWSCTSLGFRKSNVGE